MVESDVWEVMTDLTRRPFGTTGISQRLDTGYVHSLPVGLLTTIPRYLLSSLVLRLEIGALYATKPSGRSEAMDDMRESMHGRASRQSDRGNLSSAEAHPEQSLALYGGRGSASIADPEKVGRRATSLLARSRFSEHYILILRRRKRNILS
jgi:hypothetical protein